MDDETTPDRPEDGNDHVTTMKPLGTLQKHKAVRERQIWLNDKLLRECNTNNHSNTRCGHSTWGKCQFAYSSN